MKKRIFSLLLTVALLLPLTSCGNTANPPEDTTKADVTTAPEATTPEETTAEPDPEPPAYEHVVIIGVDGAGAFFKNAETPRMDEIFANGATTYECITAFPSISAQCWGAMLLGIPADVHGLNNTIVSSTIRYSEGTDPSIFRVVRQAMPEAPLCSFCDWSAINLGIIENDIDVKKGRGDDDVVTDKVIEHFKENLPVLTFVQFDSVDEAGHQQGFGGELALERIGIIDGYIGRIYDTIQEAGVGDSTLLMVVADHGGHGTDHGGDTPEEMNVFLGVAGNKYVMPGSTIQDAETQDVAAIALTALGLPVPDYMSSRVPTGVFKGITAGERRVITKKD